ncbi:hypothetical protein CJU90_6549 [Yarrowia sp. C11]|nr:hypothetical protein CJU90_6549 [Yarrowia sp. C11]KAG5371249.1 hypothetical protein CKK34_1389 [Yarrowia sp. E02]
MGYGEKLAFRNDLGGNHITLAQPRRGKGLDPSFVPRQKPGLITNTAKRAIAYIFVFSLIATVMLMQMRDDSDPNEPELSLVKKKPAPLRKDPRTQEVVLGKPNPKQPTAGGKEQDSKAKGKVNARKGAPEAEPAAVPGKSNKKAADSKDTKPLKGEAAGKADKASKAEDVNKASTKKKLEELEEDLEEQEEDLEEDLEETEDYMEVDNEVEAEARAAAAKAAAEDSKANPEDLAEKLGKKRPATDAQAKAQAKALEAKLAEDAKAAKFKEERAKQDKVKAQQKQVRDDDGEYEEEGEEGGEEEEEEEEEEVEIDDAKIAKALL